MSYVDYTLGSREKFLYPREDVVKQLLALNNLKAPLVIEPKAAEKEKGISYKELNDLNAELFVKNYKQAKIGQLQILTNKPRTVYYIALVTDVREPPPFAYFADVLPGAMGSDSAKNDFVDRVQQDMGQELLKLTVQAMRDSDANYFVSDDAKKQFAESTDSGQ